MDTTGKATGTAPRAARSGSAMWRTARSRGKGLCSAWHASRVLASFLTSDYPDPARV